MTRRVFVRWVKMSRRRALARPLARILRAIPRTAPEERETGNCDSVCPDSLSVGDGGSEVSSSSASSRQRQFPLGQLCTCWVDGVWTTLASPLSVREPAILPLARAVRPAPGEPVTTDGLRRFPTGPPVALPTTNGRLV